MEADIVSIVMESWYKVKKTGIILLLVAGILGGCGSGEPKPVEVSQLSQSLETASPPPEIVHTPMPIPTETPSPTPEPTPTPIPGEYNFTICFAGDISLAEGAVTTQRMDNSENGIYDCISAELMEYMNQADIFCLNNEFTYSLRGEPLPGKAYTFRADPERAEVLLEMGVDIVSLANNHVYDYGRDAITDTFDTLWDYDISYFGAGANLSEAMQPIYMTVDDKTIAFVGASRAEKNKMTPQATEDSPGILRCYDTELFLQVIEEASANADFVLAYVHWGTEYSHELEEVQLQTGREYLDAGADVIIGAHSHCLQGMEYYGDKPIIYSLGNYWFNKRTLDTMLLQLHFWGNDEQEHLEVRVIPAIQKEAQTLAVTDEEEKERIFDFLEEISVNVEIDPQGVVKPR
ncbi:MAG: CapA family protein [Lachnospiraceae bacterium]|nr:CapA family protein [Lachnospiraceae bacterium]